MGSPLRASSASMDSIRFEYMVGRRDDMWSRSVFFRVEFRICRSDWIRSVAVVIYINSRPRNFTRTTSMRYSTVLVELVFLSVAAFLWMGIRENKVASRFFQPADVFPTAIDNIAKESKEFDWEKVKRGFACFNRGADTLFKLKPSTKLNWSDCYDAPFQCTRFIVCLLCTSLTRD